MVAKGEYVVQEDGLRFEHNPAVDQDQSCSPEEYLVRFRCVCACVNPPGSWFSRAGERVNGSGVDSTSKLDKQTESDITD